MKHVIEQLKAQQEHELKQIGLTPSTHFEGFQKGHKDRHLSHFEEIQKEHDDQHREKAKEYEQAIKILQTVIEDTNISETERLIILRSSAPDRVLRVYEGTSEGGYYCQANHELEIK